MTKPKLSEIKAFCEVAKGVAHYADYLRVIAALELAVEALEEHAIHSLVAEERLKKIKELVEL